MLPSVALGSGAAVQNTPKPLPAPHARIVQPRRSAPLACRGKGREGSGFRVLGTEELEERGQPAAIGGRIRAWPRRRRLLPWAVFDELPRGKRKERRPRPKTNSFYRFIFPCTSTSFKWTGNRYLIT